MDLNEEDDSHHHEFECTNALNDEDDEDGEIEDEEEKSIGLDEFKDEMDSQVCTIEIISNISPPPNQRQ